MPCAPNRSPPDGAQRPLHPRSLRQHVALVRPRARRHSLPRRGRTRRRRPRRLVDDTRPCPSARGCRFEAGDRSRREFPSRRRPRACEELARSRAREHCRDPARSGDRGRTIGRRRPRSRRHLIRFTGFGASELANGVFRRPGEDAFRKGWEEIGGELEGACRRRVLRLARALHAVRPLHAGIHRPSGLDGCDAARLPRRPGARTRHRQRPVSGVDAGSTARRLPRHRRRTRSGDRPDRETLAAACEDPQ